MTTPDLIQRLRDNLAAWLPTNDHTMEARRLMEEAGIELERLRAQVAPTVTAADILAEFDRRAAPGTGFYEPEEPAQIIRAMLAASPAAPAQQAEPAAVVQEDTGRKWARLLTDLPPGALLYAGPAAPSLTVGELQEPAEEVLKERDAYAKELAACRDAFPVPEAGDPLEQQWIEAIGDPLAVADYVRAALASNPPAQGAAQPAQEGATK